ncbi:YciI family protein [Caulobacter segnis]|uniref:YciI family protein n=1 Tax=Caulobacter segnis TaxID=88688 RepID=UPI001CBCAA90|nr:YciI family protein [Caulobacter segnis]UAL10265.1 YciI family protein [Caulobacter segnis]
MQYALLIYENEDLYRTGEGRALDDIIAAHQALAGELAARGILKGGSGLKTADTATTVRKTGGQHALHDGPYAEAREQLGGFYLVEVPDLDAALAIARRVPLAGDGAVEVRPVIDED